MPRTALGLFKNAADAAKVVREIEALGLTHDAIRTLDEPPAFNVKGVMSFPRLDYEVEVGRILGQMGATREEIEGYLDGLRHGASLVFATDDDEKKVNAAADVMNRHGAGGLEQVSGAGPSQLTLHDETASPFRQTTVLAGRTRRAGGGARYFVW